MQATPAMLLQAACNRLGFVYAGACSPATLSAEGTRVWGRCVPAHPPLSRRPAPARRLPRARVARLYLVTVRRAEIWRPRISANCQMLTLHATSANEDDQDDPMRTFASESRRISLASGSGLPGRVWATRQVRGRSLHARRTDKAAGEPRARPPACCA
jgi:hypothetical protein